MTGFSFENDIGENFDFDFDSVADRSIEFLCRWLSVSALPPFDCMVSNVIGVDVLRYNGLTS